MKKIKLNLDELRVQSFDTTPRTGAHSGTIQANSGTGIFECGGTDPTCLNPTCGAQNTCDPSCAATCAGTCPNTCTTGATSDFQCGNNTQGFTNCCHTADGGLDTCINTCDNLDTCNHVCWSGPQQTCGNSCGGGCPSGMGTCGATCDACGSGATCNTCDGQDTCGHACS